MKKNIITISREFGSGGRMIGKMVAEKLGIAYYDKERLKNVLKYMTERFNSHQIMIFTCTEREKEILEEFHKFF